MSKRLRVGDEPPSKRQKDSKEPEHTPCYQIAVEINWKVKNHQERVHGRLLVDTGCTGPILNARIVAKHKIPTISRKSPVQVLGPDGTQIEGAGLRFTTPLNLVIGKHEESMSWEVGPLQDGVLGYLPISWFKKHNPEVDWHSGRLKWRSDYCKHHCLPSEIKVEEMTEEDLMDEESAYVIGSVEYHDEEGKDIALRLPPAYRNWASVFSEENILALPKHSQFDHQIKLQPGTNPPYGPLYQCSDAELKALREYLARESASGKIRRSDSPAGAPIIFVKKPDGSLRICVDYRGLNKITIKDRYPLPLMNEMRDRLRKAKIFTKLDLKNGYNLLRIASGDEWKTAFRTRYGLYEYTVMPFGLCNAPSTFQRMINEVLRDLLDEGVIVYIDDILIYSETEAEHEQLVKKVLERLKANGLCASIKKSSFHVPEVEYLGYHISEQGISMSNEKVSAVQEWPRPVNVKGVQAFLGFANFYRKFIKGFSKICHPLTELLRKGTQFTWTAACEKAFQDLKHMFTSAPILIHFNPEKPTRLETDASDYAKGAVLSQRAEDGKWHPVAYYSKKFNPAEINYDVHDKEMNAIVSSFREWDHLLKSCVDEVTVYTDHKNLEYFNTTKVLNRRQARWAEDLSEFNFKVIYRPGSKNDKTDILSRRWDHRLEEGGEPLSQPVQRLFKPGQLVLDSVHVRSVKVASLKDTFLDKLRKAALGDKIYQDTLKARSLDDGDTMVDRRITIEDGLLVYEKRWCIPDSKELRQEIMTDAHDSRVAGHFGRHKTEDKIKANFYWPKMDEDIRDYVRSCDTCQRNKSSRHKKFGLLDPLEIPYRPWSSISMDFIVALPVSSGYTQIWVIVDRLTKMAHFLPLPTEATAEDLAQVFIRELWKLHGLPDEIVSDRDSKFLSHFWKSLMERLQVGMRMSTAFHPQTDGQTERVNQTLEQYLRMYCSYQQDDWAELLPLAEYAYNSSVSASTKMSPFYANYGYEPRTQWPKTPAEQEWTNPASEVLTSQWEETWQRLHEHLAGARQRMKKWYDLKRNEAPQFSPGQSVMLDRRNIKTKRPSLKLDSKKFGPFKILERIGKNAYRLELPPQWKIHPVFNVNLLEPYRQSKDPNRHQEGPPPQEIEGEENWEVEEIVKSRPKKGRNGQAEYLVLWKGYAHEDATWEPYEHLEGSSEELLRDFHSRYPKAVKDKRLRT